MINYYRIGYTIIPFSKVTLVETSSNNTLRIYVEGGGYFAELSPSDKHAFVENYIAWLSR